MKEDEIANELHRLGQALVALRRDVQDIHNRDSRELVLPGFGRLSRLGLRLSLGILSLSVLTLGGWLWADRDDVLTVQREVEARLQRIELAAIQSQTKIDHFSEHLDSMTTDLRDFINTGPRFTSADALLCLDGVRGNGAAMRQCETLLERRTNAD